MAMTRGVSHLSRRVRFINESYAVQQGLFILCQSFLIAFIFLGKKGLRGAIYILPSQSSITSKISILWI